MRIDVLRNKVTGRIVLALNGRRVTPPGGPKSYTVIASVDVDDAEVKNALFAWDKDRGGQSEPQGEDGGAR